MIAIKYIIFAIVSTGVNLLFQFFSFEIYDLYLSDTIDNYLGVYFDVKTYDHYLSLYLGMFCGTIGGLLTKYVLDKKFIFYHQTKSKKEDVKKFFLYSMMGLFTTVIFWGTEIAFDYYSDHIYAKYVGAVVGLGIGYIIKYFLDKKFVFKAEK